MRGALGRGWLLLLVAAAGVILAITNENDIPHDGGLIVFEAAWVAFGIARVRSTAPAPALARQGGAEPA